MEEERHAGIIALTVFALAMQAFGCSESSDCVGNRTCATAIAGTSGQASSGSSGSGDGGSSASGTSNAGGSSGTSGGMGTSGEGGGGNRECDGDVSDDATCWTTNEHGVFVSSEHGDDTTADGSKELPYKTLSKGIAAAAGKKVYVCVGTDDYTERVSLDKTSGQGRIYGGFECETWTYDTSRSAQVISPNTIALRVQSVTEGAYIENVDFTAADGNGDDASSYGAFITDSKNVVLKRVKLTAGDG